jgi:hypothetical protein
LRVSSLYLAFVTLACAAAPPALPRSSPKAAPRSAPKRVIWDRFGELSSFPVAGEPFPNDGHPGAGARATVRVSPEALAAYRGLVTDSVLPDHAVVALFHDGGPGAPPGDVYVMRKTAGVWEYLRLGGDGSLPPAPEAVSACRGCHAGGVADGLFGLPRAPGGHP